MDLGELERLGLYDPHGANRTERLELLELCEARGVTLDEMIAANAIGRLPFVLGDCTMQPGVATIALEGCSERSGVEPALVLRVWAALGLVDDEVETLRFSEDDVRALQVLSVAIDTFGEAATLQLLRVWGDSLARMASAAFHTSLVHAPNSYLLRAQNEVAAAKAAAELGVMAVGSSIVTDVVFRRHLVRASHWYDRTYGPEPELAMLAVGFADLVGFTTISRRLDARALATTVEAFDAITAEAIALGGGHRVKLIGDSVMFVAADIATGVRVAELVVGAIAASEVLPVARAALAHGEVLVRDGDHFGPVVNLAARLVAFAAPNAVVVPASLDADLDDRQFTVLGALDIRGFELPLECVMFDAIV